MLQLLCLIAMEPPADDKPESILAEKVQVLRSLKPLKGATARRDTVRAQYASSESKSKGYTEEIGVAGNYSKMRHWSPEFMIRQFDTLVGLGVYTIKITV